MLTRSGWGFVLTLLGASGTGFAQGKPPAAAQPIAPVVTVDAARKDLLGADEDKAVQAARVLAVSKDPAAVDALLDALSTGIGPKAAAAACDALAQIKDARALDVLVRYAHDRNVDVRSRAVGAVGWIDDKKAKVVLLAALTDPAADVRAAAAKVAGARKEMSAVEPLIALLKKGDEPAAAALGALATPDVAREVSDLIGSAPPPLLAETLGAILLRTDFGPEPAYVEVVKALGKVPGNEAVEALTTFIGSQPANSTRPSKKEAQTQYESRLSGGN